ncbi:hypothetical protein F511_12411 [Dorcoceras hygrometricum]|uniref:Uncharacterized protein n=1 Tax=Dorcoceras hygrometricum TaxID=472368 RepID=A0A2Z7C0F6_9LAMI|nr:hypothetical protein F511_12411 [Dorcoceras hygrometricum]
MGRQPCCEKIELKRGPWTLEEDQKLMNFISNNGIQCWRLVSKQAGMLCYLMYSNFVQPTSCHQVRPSAQEVEMSVLGENVEWSKIAAHFPCRTDNEIKNHWNTRIKKKMKLLGLDPLTHKRIEPAPDPGSKEIQHRWEDQETVSSSKDGQMWQIKAEGAKVSCMGRDEEESSFKNLMQNTESWGDWSMDPFQDWIDNPFLWDTFNHLEYSFP